MLYPLPAVMVSCAADGRDNVFTAAWTGIVCTNPAMTYVSVRPERFSYDLIRKSGEFVINLVPSELARARAICAAWCRAGRVTSSSAQALPASRCAT